MAETLATTVLVALAAYSALGLAFAGWFLVRGLGRLDPTAASTGLAFRLIILPGVVALWPVLAMRLRNHTSTRPTPPAPNAEPHR